MDSSEMCACRKMLLDFKDALLDTLPAESLAYLYCEDVPLPDCICQEKNT